jgi:hypothetical protein
MRATVAMAEKVFESQAQDATKLPKVDKLKGFARDRLPDSVYSCTDEVDI